MMPLCGTTYTQLSAPHRSSTTKVPVSARRATATAGRDGAVAMVRLAEVFRQAARSRGRWPRADSHARAD
jgi:hypothetical protein